MKAELKAVGLSMKNRGLTSVRQFAVHPLASVEYVLVPLLLRILQIADQLAVSAVARGAECPGVRKSYYEQRCICATGVSLRFGESLQQQFFALEV